ncbi:MAG TPA: FAD-dependent oxidoreductase, partial [Candidatus Tumulicola sp.]|nr:FAD-dependent oxidoreductase [Candidatus Tumulicola sp.]
EDWQPLEELTAVDWLTRLSGRSVVERIWLPLLRAKLGDNAQRVSAAFIWTIIKRMYGARSSAGKSECFGYVPGGYARILERLLAYLAERGVDVETGVGVERVVPAAGERVRVERTDGTGETFDAVAVTVPAAVAAGICGELSPSERDRLSGIDYQGVVCASLLLRRPLSPYYITNITDPAPFTAVIEMDALTGTQPFGGHALVYLPKYVASSDPAFGKPDREIAAEFLEALRRMHPSLSDGDLVALRVAKARYVLPLSTLHYSERTPPFTTSIPNLYLANSTQIVNGTLNVNQTLTLGKAAADAIERDRASRPARRVEACA